MKRLYRIKNGDKMLGGVAAGLSEYLDIDPTILRILFVIGFFSPAPTVLAYFVLWVALPTKERALYRDVEIVQQ